MNPENSKPVLKTKTKSIYEDQANNLSVYITYEEMLLLGMKNTDLPMDHIQ